MVGAQRPAVKSQVAEERKRPRVGGDARPWELFELTRSLFDHADVAGANPALRAVGELGVDPGAILAVLLLAQRGHNRAAIQHGHAVVVVAGSVTHHQIVNGRFDLDRLGRAPAARVAPGVATAAGHLAADLDVKVGREAAHEVDAVDAHAVLTVQGADDLAIADVDADVLALMPDDEVARLGVGAAGEAAALEPVVVAARAAAHATDLVDEPGFLVDGVDKS